MKSGPTLAHRHPIAAPVQRRHQAGGHGGLAHARRRAGDDQPGAELVQYSMPFLATIPWSKACLTLRISVTVSAISTISGAVSWPVITTLVFGAARYAGDHVVDGHPAVFHRVGELVEDQQVVLARRQFLLGHIPAWRPLAAVSSRSVDSHVNPSPRVCHSMPRWSASLRSPVFHLPLLTNWTTPTFQPRAQPRPSPRRRPTTCPCRDRC